VLDGPTPWSRLATSIRVSKAGEASEHEADRVAGCAPLDSGLSSCGKTGATGDRGRQVQLRRHGGD
jgi:hypothetical protein